MKKISKLISSAASFLFRTKDANYQPYKLLIYYGVPQLVNHSRNNELAAQVFSRYDYIVFGADLENLDNEFHTSTKNIISDIYAKNPNAIVFGYIDLGVSTNNFPFSDIKNRTDQWASMGAKGIFLDDAGYDFQVPRDRLNTSLEYIHSMNMSAFVNAWNADDIMADLVDPIFNPSGTPTQMGSKDFYLLESFFVNTSAYESNDGCAANGDYKTRGDTAVYYRNKLGVKMLATNIVDYSSYSGAQVRKFFKMSETAAAIFSLDGYGLSPLEYSASGTSANIVRSFKFAADYMSYYEKDVSYEVSPDYAQFTRGNIILYSVPGNHWYQMP